MLYFNPTSIVLIAFASATGAVFGHALVGLSIALGLILAADVIGGNK